MEKKKGTGLVIFLVLVILAMGGFITYDKVLKDKYFSKDSDESKEVENNKEDNKTKDNNNTKEKTADEMYEEYLENFKKSYGTKINEERTMIVFGKMALSEANYSYEITKDKELYIDIDYTGKFKIDSNVINMFLIDVGQSGMAALYYIKNDGNLYKFIADDFEDKEVAEWNSIKGKKVNLKNIVSVNQTIFGKESSARGPIFIDIEGNIYTEE